MTQHYPYVIGITGTIASGKSSVGRMLEARNIPVIDTDQIVHYLLEQETPTRKAVVELFGAGIVSANAHGAIDRATLGRRVFSDLVARRELEAIVHPAVRAECRKRIAELSNDPIVAVLVPLLFEAGLKHEYNEIWTVYTSADVLKDRLRTRDKLSESEIENRLSAQWSQEKKASLSDNVIDNSFSYSDTEKQVDRLIEKRRLSL